MAYIVPDAVVELFSDISLDSGYENTLYFADTSSKDTYFTNLYATKGLGRFTDLSYNREQRGYIRLGMTRATAINATYMRFKNTSFENKWFYAFVLNAEYINNGCTEIHFALDVMMTWMGSFTLGQCFIERQHVLNDSIGANIAEEGLGLGDYVIEDTFSFNDYDPVDSAIIIVYADDQNAGGYMSNIYSGCALKVCHPTATDKASVEATQFLQDMIDNNKIDSVVGIYMLPDNWANNAEQNPELVHYGQFSVNKPYHDICGYIPKNKKLFTYPYKYLEITNNVGSSQEFAYEYFNGLPPTPDLSGACQFRLYYSVGANCDVALVPVYYNMHSNTQTEGLQNWSKRLGTDAYPEASFAIDSYRAYRAQKNASIDYRVNRAQSVGNFTGGIASSTGDIFNTHQGKGLLINRNTQRKIANTLNAGMESVLKNLALGPIYSNPLIANAVGTAGTYIAESGGIKNALTDIADILITNNSVKREPDILQGSATPNAMWGLGEMKYLANRKSITKNYAMMIDDFFTMFGYAVRQIGVPNMNARPYFTYVKTVGCIAHGDMPSDHARKIEEVMDSGVRFWKSVDNIGNYNLNNAPV